MACRLSQMDNARLRRRWPQMNFDGIEFGLFEPDFGALMARRASKNWWRGSSRVAANTGSRMRRPAATATASLLMTAAQTRRSHRLRVRAVAAEGVSRCAGRSHLCHAPGNGFIAPPDGDDSFEVGHLPGWADFNGGDLYYGFPNLEGRGFKIARDTHGADFDPDTGDRRMSEAGAALLRTFAERRFPALAGRPFTEFRVCQYENSSNGDFLIDRHPTLDGTFCSAAGQATASSTGLRSDA